MLTLSNVSIARGANMLIEKVNLSVFAKQCIGVLGANGCGKSSLFAVLQGEEEAAAGAVEWRKDVRISSLAQEVAALDISALDYTISGDAALSALYQKLRAAEDVQDFETIMQCHSELHDCDGYSAEARAAKILIGLGFSQDELSQAVKSFSGGWRMRLDLARCLFAPSDFLLLDEPTNHLDMEAIVWLESFIKQYQGGILLISHDQEFLDHVVTHIAHVIDKRLTLYKGNYSSFEEQRAEALAVQASQYQKQQAKITHMMKYVDRFRAKASKAKQAQSRLKAIEKMERIAPVLVSSPFTFSFQEPPNMPNPMLVFDKVDLGYGDKRVLKRVGLSLLSGQRIGLLGINGAGKSTLIKGLCGELKPMSGHVLRPSGISIGYFAQHQVDHLPLDYTPMGLLKARYPAMGEREILTYLGGFNFPRDQALSAMTYFSGGEKARVALALLILQKPNLLLLDEPTNHLDLEVRQALILALQEYNGALLLVSHDRHLLRTLVDELYIIQDGKLETFNGTIEDYQKRVVV